MENEEDFQDEEIEKRPITDLVSIKKKTEKKKRKEKRIIRKKKERKEIGK